LEQYNVIVKVRGSFRLAVMYSASSRRVQFRWVNVWDTKRVVIPFMQDNTYLSRNFATLRSSELQPSFTRR